MTCSCGFKSNQKCKEIFDIVIAREFSDFRYAKFHRLTIDTYSLQHPDPYLISAKSFAAHLTGRCCAIEYDNDSNLLRILQQWLNGKKQLEKPKLLDNVGNPDHVVSSKGRGWHRTRQIGQRMGRERLGCICSLS